MHKDTKTERCSRLIPGHLWSALCTASLLALCSPQAAAQAPSTVPQSQEINLPGGPLGPTLVTLADIYGINVVAANSLVKGKVAAATSGTLRPNAALTTARSGTGLMTPLDTDGAFIVTKKKGSATVPDAPIRLIQSAKNRKTADTEELFVLGRRSVQSYFDVTDSVAITTGEEIEREPLADLYDIITRIPNVNRENQTGLGFAIRGIRDGGPARAGDGPLLAVNVDDAPLNGPGAGLGPTGAGELEQVEVFRGPQSTNFGRNSLAGAIYMRTKDPVYEWDLKARAEIGNYGQRWGAIAFGGGIINDKLAFRVAGDYRETQGFTFNQLLNTFADNTEVWNTRFKLRFDPLDSLSIITTTTYAENLGGPSIVPLPPQVNGELQDPSDAARETPTDVDSFFQTENLLQSVNINWDVSDRWSVKSITTYQVTDFSGLNDGDLSPIVNNITGNENKNKTLTQEVRLIYSSNRLAAVLGGFYSDIESENIGLFGVNFGPVFGSPIPLFINQNSVGNNERDNFAFFVDGEYDVSNSLSLLFGFRYDDESFTNVNIASRSVEPFPFPPEVPVLSQILVLNIVGTGEGDPETVSGSYNAALPKAGIRWQPNDDFNIAFVAQRAYRAGGVQANPDNLAELIPFDPEYLWNYEISARASFLGGRLTWNNNIFYSKWTDMQVRVFSEGALGAVGAGFTANAGRAQLYGGETELRFKLNSEVSTYFSAGYSKTEFLEFVNAEFDPDAPLTPQNSPNYNGNRFNSAPEFSFNGGFDYNRPDGFFGGMDFSYQSDAFGTPFNFPENFAGERLLFNARIGYAINEHFRITAVGRNLFDTDYFFAAFRSDPNGGSGRLGDPLTWAIRLDVKF
ncbi:MAG: TonB-dependent receptor [Sphingomonadales bacterium]